MSGGSFGYPRHKPVDEVGRYNIEGMIALLEKTGHGDSRAAADLRTVLEKLAEGDALLNGLAEVVNTLDRIPSGDDGLETLAEDVEAYEKGAP